MDDNFTKSLGASCFAFTCGVVCCLVLLSCQHTTPLDKPMPAVEPLTFKPINYFEFNCARCHGSYGSSYGDSFGEGMTDHELVEFVDDMASGPGQAPIEGQELEAQIAFHRSLVTNTPFIAWTGWDGETLSGEVTAGSNVSIQIGGESRIAIIKNEQWELTIPDLDNSLGNIVITATAEGATSKLHLARHAFTHSDKINQ